MASLSAIRSSDHPLDLRAAARDLWPGGTLDWWQGRPLRRPLRVFWPEDEDQVAELLRAASEQGVPVVPYGAGSGVCGGAAGRPDAWVIDTKSFDHIGPLDPERRTITAGAGVNGEQLERWLADRGWTMGHSPSSISCSTVGGWVAARSAGQFSSRYGVIEDMVLSIRAVAPGPGAFTVGDGGDAPAAWMDQLLGSEGTLGVLTAATFRVWPAPASRWLRGYRFPDIASALDAMRRLMQGELHPAVVRLYDPVDTRIGGKTRPKSTGGPSGAKRWLRAALGRVDRLPALHQRSLALPLALPGLVNRLLDRAASGCLLILGWEGDPQVVAAAAEAGHRIASEQGEDLGAGPGETWYASRHAVSYKLMPVFERGGFADTMEIAGRWSDLLPAYHAVRDAVRAHVVVMAHMSHVYPEGGCIYFSFAGRGDRVVYQQVWDAAQRAVLDAGCTVTHHHGVGALKADAASREVGPAVAGWRALKQELDPRGILNPGRLYVEVADRDPGPPSAPVEDDGLARADAGADLATRRAVAEPMWPWERLPGPPRWQRLPWQTPWVEVEGAVDGKRCRLGRGPRSAAGPDLREWLADRGPATATWAREAPGPRWMGEGSCAHPWRVALELLRSDLRPAVLAVIDGRLRVGFRGPAAEAFGAIAAARVPGGLAPRAWEPTPLPAGPLAPCAVDDPAACHLTTQGAWRRA